jgi:hypothetical protein
MPKCYDTYLIKYGKYGTGLFHKRGSSLSHILGN